MDVIKAALYKLGVPFTVAPYSALAQVLKPPSCPNLLLREPQLAYFEQHPSRYIDAIYGPTELFYFGVEKIIIDFGLTSEDSSEKSMNSDAEQSQFRWIDSAHCLRALGGGIHPQIFSEALILAGSEQFLSTYPPLSHKAGGSYPPGNVIRDAVQFIMSTRGNLSQPLESVSSAERDRWLNEYKQMMTIIRHHVVITVDGDVECLNKDRAPIDVHDCIGLRLPEELYMYLAQGAIGTRVLNYLTRDEVVIPTPLAGAGSSRFQDFVSKELEILRRQPICLLTAALHRYYQRTDFHKHLWFDRNLENKFKPIDVNPAPGRLVSKWFVRTESIKKVS